MNRTQCQFSSQHFDNNLWFKPNISFHFSVNPRMLFCDLELCKHFWHFSKLIVSKSDSKPAQCFEQIFFVVVGSAQQCPINSTPFPPAKISSNNHQIKSVPELFRILFFPLNPKPGSCPCFVNSFFGN